MKKLSKSNSKLLSIALMIIGAGLTFWGYQKSQGIGSQLSSAFTGSHSNTTMMLYISGVVCLVIGIVIFRKK